MLGACAPLQLSAAAPAIPSPTVGRSPTGTFTPTVAPTFTVTVTITSTESPTGTPTETPTHLFTGTKSGPPHIFPVQPPEKTDFAEGGHTHTYPATDIFTAAGSNFVAVTDGVVDFVSYADLWDPAADDPAVAGGLCVAIVGDDGVRYYGSHLSAVAAGIRPGVRVTAGRLLGLTGNSGNARNTQPHLHFGISHPTYPEDWKTRRGEIDPYPYLIAWLRGENVTPKLPTPTSTPS